MNAGSYISLLRNVSKHACEYQQKQLIALIMPASTGSVEIIQGDLILSILTIYGIWWGGDMVRRVGVGGAQEGNF